MAGPAFAQTPLAGNPKGAVTAQKPANRAALVRLRCIFPTIRACLASHS